MLVAAGFRGLLIAIFLVQVKSVSVVDRQQQQHADPNVIHRINYEEALQEARNVKLYPVAAGCKPCTREEMTYCRNESVIQDHCCCDHAEPLGFVEHVCLISTEACQVHAGNCGEYMRLRECCCHTYLVSDWKYKAGGADSLRAFSSFFILNFSSICCTVIVIRLFI